MSKAILSPYLEIVTRIAAGLASNLPSDISIHDDRIEELALRARTIANRVLDSRIPSQMIASDSGWMKKGWIDQFLELGPYRPVARPGGGFDVSNVPSVADPLGQTYARFEGHGALGFVRLFCAAANAESQARNKEYEALQAATLKRQKEE